MNPPKDIEKYQEHYDEGKFGNKLTKVARKAGYTDDLTAVIWALHTVWKNITPEIRAQAAIKTREWFGDFDQTSVDEQLGK